MSAKFLRLIPTDPSFVPDLASAQQARARLAQLTSATGHVTATTTDHIEFVDQGSNFERLCCSSCGQELDWDWWSDRMNEAFKNRFTNRAVSPPCCGANVDLNDLKYEWPAGFARFVLEALYAREDLSGQGLAELSEMLGTPLRKIWAHY